MTWDRIRGHDVVIKSLQRAHRHGRLAHAYLFCGPRGVGKHLFATEFARALLCEGRNDADPLEACGRCPACVQVDAGSHPDFASYARPEDTQEFPIDLMREVCHGFALKSVRGHGKVVVIDDADDLNPESANCFLKTLEEPPPRAVLILIGTRPERQLPTIVSRCQVVRFGPLPDTVVRDLVQEHGTTNPDLADRLVRLAAGSPGTAISLVDPALWEFREALLASISQPHFDFVELGKTWIDFVESAGKESAPRRRRAKLVFRLLIDFLSDALARTVSAPPRFTDQTQRAALDSFAAHHNPEQVLDLLERSFEAERQIDRNVPLALIVEAFLDAFVQVA